MMLIVIALTIISIVAAVVFGVLWGDIFVKYKNLKQLYQEAAQKQEQSIAIIQEQKNIIDHAIQKAQEKISEANAEAQEKIYRANEEADSIIKDGYSKALQESSRITSAAENTNSQLQQENLLIRTQITELQKEICQYQDKAQSIRNEITQLNNKLQPLREEEENYDIAFYMPHYNLNTVVEFERELNNNHKKQQKFIRDKIATTFHAVISDKKQDTLLSKLLLKAFGAECDLYMRQVDYKNVVTYEKRIENLFDQLNKLTAPYFVQIDKKYMSLKQEELRIIYEMQEKKQKEQEEQRRIKEIMRDELRAEREMEKAKAEAEKEQANYQRLLERALAQAERAKGEELDKMNAQIVILQQQLEEAREKERKISEAQKTKAGHVYIISNIGSFGENVYKIGMTRRLEPQERIDELGDASVPFPFDVHAMIWHENAPELENKLHQTFENHRINKINSRKEFFRVPLENIADVVKKNHGDIHFTMFAEAKEYRQSLAMEKSVSE